MISNVAKSIGIAEVGIVSRLTAPVSVEIRLLALAVTVGAVLYVALFSGMAPVHDVTHSLRHSILTVACH